MTDTISAPTRLHDPNVRGFASDNYSGVHPEILAALAAAERIQQVMTTPFKLSELESRISLNMNVLDKDQLRALIRAF